MSAIQTFAFEGCPLAYRIDGQGPPVVMIQGVGAYGTSAPNPLIDRLSPHYRCLNFDNRGVGLSRPAGRNITVPQMATDALALMDHMAWPTAHIVGHSFGGLTSLQLALMAKERVRSLTLLNSFADGASASRMTAKILWILLRLRYGPRAMRRAAFMELVVPHGFKGDRDKIFEMLSGVYGHDIADLPAEARLQMKVMRAHDLTGSLAVLDGVPTLAISAEHDLIARPELGRAIAAEIPGGRYIEIAGASHSFPVLEPERCAALILEHLNAVEAARAA